MVVVGWVMWLCSCAFALLRFKVQEFNLSADGVLRVNHSREMYLRILYTDIPNRRPSPTQSDLSYPLFQVGIPWYSLTINWRPNSFPRFKNPGFPLTIFAMD